MLVVLPPSETKSHGGTEPALDFEALSFPPLTPIRRAIAQDLVALNSEKAPAILGLSAKQQNWVTINQHLFTSPCMSAVLRYTGVLYDSLDPTTLSEESLNRIAIGDALFGLIKASDLIPNYRLSGSVKLPISTPRSGVKTRPAPTMRSRWGAAISAVLATHEGIVIDLRSGVYQQLGKHPEAITVKVLSQLPDGSRKVVSHFNKHYKGLLARCLVQSPTSPTTAAEVAAIARAAGLVIEEQPGKQELLMIV